MRKIWWKIVTVLLLLYVISMTFLVKLDPGLIGTDTGRLSPGVSSVVITGHNTHFGSLTSNEFNVFLEHDRHFICAQSAEAIDNTSIRVSFNIPDTLLAPYFNLFVNNAIDGNMFLANAFFVDGVVITSDPTEYYCKPAVENTSYAGFGFPFQPVIFESIRNLMLHVPMWFTMFFIMLIGFISSLRYLNKPSLEMDLRAVNANRVGLLFAVLGLITGSIWARFTWGDWWVADPQLNGALVTFLIYVGYMVLRAQIEDEQKRARVAAVFNIFAYVILFILLMILPRFTEGLHPGKGGNPGFNTYDLDSSLRAVFYPAVTGWILLGYWIYHLRLRLNRAELKLYYDEKA